ncbi:MAG: DUF502 domain-containing protein [Proteobacteria bacterium]|nr:DUF502 domain-containing protein [Pseudomonadota bacterium]MCL2308501.1 DUF502 domain-containing protein [Pseudomonadota bacterium]
MKRYLIAGLLVWIPLGITLWVLYFLLSALDQLMLLIPYGWRPEQVLGFRIYGLGVVMGFLILLSTGIVAANIFGARLIALWEQMLGRIPFVKSIYSSVKQVSDTILSKKSNAFRKALLVEFPRKDSWTIAFLTGSPAEEIAEQLDEPYVSVYVPTTPNPTSGYFVMLPKSQVRELQMTVDEALKYVVSMGVLDPHHHAHPPRHTPVIPPSPSVAPSATPPAAPPVS